MVLKITTKKGKLPIEIGDLTFYYDITDEGQEKLHKGAKKFEKRIKVIAGEDLNNLEVVREILEETFDFILGKGSFEQIYEQTPSTLECIDIAYELIFSLAAELQERNAGMITKMAKLSND